MSAAKYPALNERQYLNVLEIIASRADLISAMAADCAGRLGRSSEAMTVHGLSALARQIGAMADEASGGRVIGGVLEWECGYPFEQEKCTRAAIQADEATDSGATQR